MSGYDFDDLGRADPGAARRAGENAKAWTPPPGGNGKAEDTTDDTTTEENTEEATAKQYQLTRLSDVSPQPVEWLWKDRLAVGKLMLLGGDPDMGKSLICCDIAARLSTQTRWPSGLRPHRKGGTIFLCSEDDMANTIRPRCEAANADLTALHVFKMRTAEGKQKTFSLQSDLETLSAAIKQSGAILVCIDAITSYMGKIDSHRTTDVRSVLEPLADFAEAHRVCMIGVTHPPKAAQGSALRAYTGSFAFIAAPRLAFFVTTEPDSDRRLFLPVKNNLGPKASGIGYRIGVKTITRDITAPHVLWSDEPVDHTADQAIAAAHAAAKDGGSLLEAKDFLRQLLDAGPVPAKEAEDAAKAHGVSERTLRRARKELGVTPFKEDFHGEWKWTLSPGATAGGGV